MRLVLSLVLAMLCSACAAAPVSMPGNDTAMAIPFVAWYKSNGLEVPMQGVLRLTHDGVSHWKIERMGLVMTQGQTVGVTQWNGSQVRRETSAMPGSLQLLRKIEEVMVNLMQQRGINVPAMATTLDCAVVEKDNMGPLELRCGGLSEQVTVRITGEQR